MNLTRDLLDEYIDNFAEYEGGLDDHDRMLLSNFIEFLCKNENYDGPPDHFGEPPITNEERLKSGMVKPR